MKNVAKVRLPRWWAGVAITLLLAVLFCAIGCQKSGYHVDEVYTFGLSNHDFNRNQSIMLTFTDGEHYAGQEIWDNYMTIAAGHRFDYANVMVNQAHDVHPPLYYLIIHTLCSLFPRMPLLWVGLLVNVPLACIAYWQLVWIAGRLGVPRKFAVPLLFAYVMGMGFLSFGIAFFRMYTLFMVWEQLLVICFLRYPPDQPGRRGYYLLLGVAFLGGILTQYYFLIVSFLCCCTYGVFLVLARNWKKLAGSVVTCLVGLGLGLAIFPAAIQVMQNSNRGQEARENLLTGNLLENFWEYLKLMGQVFFGELFVLLLIVGICLALLVRAKDRWEIGRTAIYNYCLLVVPSLLYLLIVAKIAPFRTERYVFPMMGLLYLAVFALLYRLAVRVARNARWVVLLLAGLVLFSSHRNPVGCLYLDRREHTRMLESHQDAQCVFLYDTHAWRIVANYPDLRCMNDVVFVSTDDWDTYKDTDYGRDSMVVFLEGSAFDPDKTLETLMQANGFTSSTFLFGSGYANVYYLE